ncbi:MAG: D-alanine--D-alanine ligase [Rickettsiaceae bacterium]|nr:D-alanine--D-alanine ligase [Rickettsiaceae bacterium]
MDFVKENGQVITNYDRSVGIKHVLVIGGGMSAEREVSYMSSSGIISSILELGYEVTFVDKGMDIGLVLDKLKPNLVFNALHGTYGEDGCLPGLLNIMRIPYTGCGVLASSLTLNKIFSHHIFKANNFKIPQMKVVNKSDKLTQDPMPRPYVIKPISQGSSIGVEIIFPNSNFNFADYKFAYGDEIIVEEYIKGREMQVAILEGKALGVLEIKLLKGKVFYDYEVKYVEGFAEHLLPAPINQDIYSKLLKVSELAVNVLSCHKGMIRAEFIYNEEEQEIYLLELNTHPGMTPLSICPEIAEYNGISYTELVKQMLEGASFEK